MDVVIIVIALVVLFGAVFYEYWVSAKANAKKCLMEAENERIKEELRAKNNSVLDNARRMFELIRKRDRDN